MKKVVCISIELAICLLFFQLPAAFSALMGDVNNDQQISLVDTIVSIQMCTDGMPAEWSVDIEADVNGDHRIGMAEALFGMEILSGVRHHPDIDDDNDGHTENQGDCNDANDTVFPGATETCGDGIDQDCVDGDLVCVPEIIHADEDFTSGMGGFLPTFGFHVEDGRLWFTGNMVGTVYLAPWNGGLNPSHNAYPVPENSNYFDNFYVSADFRWHDGLSDRPFGLSFCQQINLAGGLDLLTFWITRDGFYAIGKYVNNVHSLFFNFKRSFLLNIGGGSNELAVQKTDNAFRFFINGAEVERWLIDNFEGGGVGIAASDAVTISVDDFTVTNPYQGNFVWLSEGHLKKCNELVHEVMTSTYLWYDQVPSVTLQDYESPDVLLNDLIYRDLDKWSFITTQQQYNDLINQGQYIGLGFGMELNLSEEIVLSYVYDGTPAKDEGLKRGDVILKVNGRTTHEIFQNNLWQTIWGEDEEGVTVELQIRNTAGEIFDLVLEKRKVQISPVLHHDIIQQGSENIGYLVYNNFVMTEEDDEEDASELDAVFFDFIQAGISELVLDLRYNPGGLLYLAQYLSSRIAEDEVGGEIFMNVVHNDKYQIWDATYRFENPESTLNLSRLLVITQNGTCSASEQLISSLRPFIEVVTIGKKTCGKPVGMYGYDFYGLHISPIEFQNTNSIGEGGYFSGIPPTCTAGDDFTRQLGDPEEDSLKEALQYFLTGECSQVPARTGPQKSLVTETDKRSIMLQGFRREIGAF